MHFESYLLLSLYFQTFCLKFSLQDWSMSVFLSHILFISLNILSFSTHKSYPPVHFHYRFGNEGCRVEEKLRHTPGFGAHSSPSPWTKLLWTFFSTFAFSCYSISFWNISRLIRKQFLRGKSSKKYEKIAQKVPKMLKKAKFHHKKRL